jgi:EAL domain-containing protein (putative c-di-GMP-specific phosphodiesterase class I)
MAFSRESRSSAGPALSACQSPDSTRNGPLLLLAPLDTEASHVLSSQLTSANISFHTRGPVLAVPVGALSGAELMSQLQARLSVPLQNRVKGVVADRLVDADDLVRHLMRAELLPELFDRSEVEWVRAVLDQDRVFSVYHPIVRACDASIFAYEALIRARALKSDELIGAGQLLYAARKLNLHHEFDRRARISAIRGAARGGLQGSKLFINFMPNTIYDPHVCLRSTVEEAEQTGFGMDRIVFEVIETEQIGSIDRLRQIVAFLKSHGAGVALDDISSGYASLQFLADLVPDYVKIDRDLVTMAAAQGSARHTLESIVGLARKLEIKVIAEGVETDGQLEVCVEAGVDYMQGFLFALPGCPPHPVVVPQSMRMAA